MWQSIFSVVCVYFLALFMMILGSFERWGGGLLTTAVCASEESLTYTITTLPNVVRRCRMSDMPLIIRDISSTCGCMDILVQ
jgi:hypothetical protein